MTVVSPRDRVHHASETPIDPLPGTCPVCGHPGQERALLARVERGTLRLLGRPSRCGAEITDLHEATAWGEPPCACTDSFHR